MTLPPLRILISNDDGIHAAGLAVLARVAARWGEVTVVAPETERSGASHAITLHAPLRVREIEPLEVGGASVRRLYCSGTPTDCVYVALHHVYQDGAPDIVLSGINAGPNLAHDTLYSGTVAAALEATYWGIAAVAVSHCGRGEAGIALLEPVLPEVLEPVMALALQSKTTYNVNFPSSHKLPFRGVQVTHLGSRWYSNEVIERADPRGQPYYWIGGAQVKMPDRPGTDCNAIRDNFVSVTPLADDLTRHGAVADVALALSSLATRSLP